VGTDVAAVLESRPIFTLPRLLLTPRDQAAA
jgi:hypothetical protein